MATRMSSFSSSPRMRSAPHSRFSAAISRISAIVSAETCGRFDARARLGAPDQAEALPMPAQQRLGLDDQQRGAPGADAARQQHQAERGRRGCSRGRLTWRRGRGAAGAGRRSRRPTAAFVLARSPTALPTRGPVAGLVHARRRRWTARRQGPGTLSDRRHRWSSPCVPPLRLRRCGAAAACAHATLSQHSAGNERRESVRMTTGATTAPLFLIREGCP